jgi:DNA-binding transcriptional MerR regulator
MPEATDTSYLSIGEVLGLLLEDFPDVTISKIRFLESQGLISPERTASGYRKFYDHDVQLLRVILTEQHQNYLPLRVIKDRLDSGEIDPTGEHLRPDGDDPAAPPAPDVPTVYTPERGAAPTNGADDSADDHTPAEIPAATLRSHPTARSRSAPDPAPMPDPEPERQAAAAQLLPGVLLDRAELCAMVGITDAELTELESFGIVQSRQGSGTALYGDDAVSIAKPASQFLRLGIDARHLRNWRTSAEREASLYEQIVTPRFRQRNPEARAEALAQLGALDTLGASLRAAMTRQALRHHFES